MKHKHPSGSLWVIFGFRRACLALRLVLPTLEHLLPLAKPRLIMQAGRAGGHFSKNEAHLLDKARGPGPPGDRRGHFLVLMRLPEMAEGDHIRCGDQGLRLQTVAAVRASVAKERTRAAPRRLGASSRGHRAGDSNRHS